ncbi:MAG: hypothetical protein ACYC1C_05150 [Chloroflexota bacterium]
MDRFGHFILHDAVCWPSKETCGICGRSFYPLGSDGVFVDDVWEIVCPRCAWMLVPELAIIAYGRPEDERWLPAYRKVLSKMIDEAEYYWAVIRQAALEATYDRTSPSNDDKSAG